MHAGRALKGAQSPNAVRSVVATDGHLRKPLVAQLLHSLASRWEPLTKGRWMTFRIGIVGAGVAGAVIAAGAADIEDVDVVCMEKTGPDDHVHAGNGLNLGPNALRALDTCLPQLASALHDAGLPWERWQARLADGSRIYTTPLDWISDCAGVRIRWAELYKTVRQAAGSAVRYSRQPERVTLAPGGSVTVQTSPSNEGAAGEELDFDLLIAADGRYSALRAQFDGEPQPRHLGVSNFRALVNDGGTLAIDDMEQWFNGPRRLICFRLRDGLLYVSGNLPIEAGAPVPDSYKHADFLATAYTEGVSKPDQRLAALSVSIASQADQLHWARAQEIEPLFHDTSERVLYIGDAAHAMCPTLGQGATMALEDAAVLVSLLRASRRNGTLQASSICRAFRGLREERVRFVKQFSWDASDTLLFGSDPWSGNLKKASTEYLDRFRQLYSHIPFPDPQIEHTQATYQDVT